MATPRFLIVQKRSFHFILVLVFAVVVKFSGAGSNQPTSKPPAAAAKVIDYDAIRNKISDLRHAILDALHSIKADALADKENAEIGREIAEMCDTAEVIVLHVSDLADTMAQDGTLTEKLAKAEFGKIQQEITNLKIKVVKDVKKLSYYTVAKILGKAYQCYKNTAQDIRDIYDLLRMAYDYS